MHQDFENFLHIGLGVFGDILYIVKSEMPPTTEILKRDRKVMPVLVKRNNNQ